jgi:uncharacterized protein
MSEAQHGHARRPGTNAGFAELGRVLVVRLGPGEDVLPAMAQVLEDSGMDTGVILGGVASLEHASVRNIWRFPASFPITPEDRKMTTVPGPIEILALQGNFAPKENGEVVIHAHVEFSVGAPPAVTYGGHLVENTIVGTTCELYLAELTGMGIARTLDPNTQALEIEVDAPIR